MFNFTSTNHNKKRNVSTRQCPGRATPPTPPPPASIPHTPSTTPSMVRGQPRTVASNLKTPEVGDRTSLARIVMEGVGMGAGAAIGRSIVERGFQSLTTPSQQNDTIGLSSVSEKHPSTSIVPPPLHDDCECHIESYQLCVRNKSGQCDYTDCKKMYDDYVSCVMAHPIT